VRAFWLARQGLGGPSAAGVAGLVHDTGWLPSAGGQCAYLALRARRPDLGRAGVDRGAFVDRALLELPGPRGVAMLVPAGDAALALRATRASDDARYAKVKAAEGIRDAEIERLCDAILEALRGGALGPDELRAAFPARLVRSLGEAGKKLGDATTLPIALRRLQVAGEVLRTSATGRLDSGRYVYARFDPNPLDAPAPAGDVAALLGARFFAWAGPATRADFAFWAGLSQTAAKAAMASLRLSRVEVPELPDELWILSADTPSLEEAEPGPDRAVLLPFRDNHVAFRRNLAALVDPASFGLKVTSSSQSPALLGDAGPLHHHVVLYGGRIAGVWEYDLEARCIVWGAIAKLSAAQRKAIAAEVEAVAAFVSDELGDAKFYALDNEKNRARRLAAVRAL
jgi:hypothetical protein